MAEVIHRGGTHAALWAVREGAPGDRPSPQPLEEGWAQAIATVRAAPCDGAVRPGRCAPRRRCHAKALRGFEPPADSDRRSGLRFLRAFSLSWGTARDLRFRMLHPHVGDRSAHAIDGLAMSDTRSRDASIASMVQPTRGDAGEQNPNVHLTDESSRRVNGRRNRCGQRGRSPARRPRPSRPPSPSGRTMPAPS